jgi:formylglycine-generating enzyme required for sulfatase activity
MSIEKSFLLGETEITQELYYAIMKKSPSQFKGNPKHPVECVSWYDALIFCNKLSDMINLERYYTITKDGKIIDTIETEQKNYLVEMNRSSKGFRLPTEWEWEYAAKAGTQLEYSGSDNPDEVAWYYDMTIGNNIGTCPIKKKKPNAWGFYDMSGNVIEWCENKYSSKSEIRVIRGDGWDGRHRIAHRWFGDPSNRYHSWGFRVCRYM